MKKSVLYAATFLLCSSHAASADAIVRPQLIDAPGRRAATVESDNQYAIEVRCEPLNGELQDPSDGWKNRNRSLFVLIAPNAPSTVDKLPSDLLAAIQVYSIGRDKDTNAQNLVDDRSCRKDFLINGKKDIGIVVSDNRIDDYVHSTFGQVLSGALGLVSPLFSLFTGTALPAVVTGKFDNITSVQQKVASILTALNQGKNYTRPIRGLKVGQYVITSDYAKLTITVRPVPSIVLDKNPAFKNDLKAQITTASVKVDAGNLSSSCRGAQYDVWSLGFRSTVDLAYALTHLSAHAGFTIPQSITCLTKEYATAAAKADNRFWDSFPPAFVIKPKAVDDAFAPPPEGQPSFDDASATLDPLVRALARYARNTPEPADSVADLTKYLAAQVTVADNTISKKIGDAQVVDRFAAMKLFKNSGYIRFGCYAPVDDATDKKVDGATSMFLVFNAPNDADSATLKQALVIRPQFTGTTISTLAISDNRSWITAVLNKRSYQCNDFSVQRPAAEIASR